MKSRRGFTLIELMVVVLIVAVLAAVLIPMLTARLEAARWSEGKAGAGTIATSIRAMVAEEGEEFDDTDLDVITYVKADDLQGRWFGQARYTITSLSYPGTTPYPVDYVIQVTAPPPAEGGTAWNVPTWYLNNNGQWSKTGTFPAFTPPL